MELHYAERRLNVRKSIALLVMFGAFLMAHENCGERFILQRFRTNNRIRSPRLTASGQHDNVDKGSRQNRSVTSGKGLALRIEYLSPFERRIGEAIGGFVRLGRRLNSDACDDFTANNQLRTEADKGNLTV